MNLSRRSFLGHAAVAGTAALFPSATPVLVANSRNAESANDIAEATGTAVVARRIVEPFPMSSVRLLPSQWKQMMELDRSYLYSLPNDRLAHTFRLTAGIPSDADPLGGWEAPGGELRGHYIGHYLSSCALLHASTGDEPILAKANDLVAILSQCQAQDGYLGAYPTEFYDRLRRHEKVWAPFYTYHKIMAGLIDMYQLTGNQQALSMALHMADWADNYSRSISNEEWQKVLLVEHGGMNEACFNLYAITGQIKYRDLAYRFEHKKIFDPLAAGEDKLDDNHANTNIPKMIGAARGYELTGNERYRQISENFHRIVSSHHTYCTGGTSDGEMWHAPDAIAAQLGPDAEECCCSYNMMKLSRLLFSQAADAKLFDYYERVLFNVRSGTQDSHGMLMYYVSLQPGMYKTFGTPLDSFWCCTGTGSEEYAKLTDSIYFHDERSVFVNLFIPSTLNWKEQGLRLRQTTKFPHDDRISFLIDSAPNQPIAIKVRIPWWADSGVAVAINGEPQRVVATPSTYLSLEHKWKPGDIITIDLHMQLHIASAPDNNHVQAAMYGPLVLAARLGAEGLTTSMIEGPMGPRDHAGAYPMPEVDMRPSVGQIHDGAPSPASIATGDAVWLERVEGTAQYPLLFRTIGRGPSHSLAPLNSIMDERYSVYLRNVTTV